MDLPKTNDHLNDENDLFKKFAFEPLIKSASSFLYLHKGGIAQKLLYSLKYHGKQDVGYVLGEDYGVELSKQLNPDIIVPVPIHKSKKRRRGYNQSTYIANGISKALGNVEVKEDLISRTKRTETQTKKSRIQRWENANNIYSEVADDLSGKSVLVVDDVITTGATIGMLCDQVKKANAKSLHIVAIARGQ